MPASLGTLLASAIRQDSGDSPPAPPRFTARARRRFQKVQRASSARRGSKPTSRASKIQDEAAQHADERCLSLAREATHICSGPCTFCRDPYRIRPFRLGDAHAQKCSETDRHRFWARSKICATSMMRWLGWLKTDLAASRRRTSKDPVRRTKQQFRIFFSLVQPDSSLLSFRHARDFFQTKLEASGSHPGACRQL